MRPGYFLLTRLHIKRSYMITIAAHFSKLSIGAAEPFVECFGIFLFDRRAKSKRQNAPKLFLKYGLLWDIIFITNNRLYHR